VKKSLAHLPKHKRYELKLIVEQIRQLAEAEEIVLFGSYARGDWVEDRYTENNVTYEYASDFDILVIVESSEMANSTDIWRKIDKKIRRFPIKTWTNVIVETVDSVNAGIAKGNYFFTDISKEGILLYDSRKFKLARPKKLNPKERRGQAKFNFKEWFTSAKEFVIDFNNAFKRRSYKKAAFELHQAVERFYTTILLVFTNYKPKTHDLEKFSHMAAGCDPAFLNIFPQAAEEQKKCFDLLKRAYVEARYNPAYKITKLQLEYLSTRVRKLQRLTKKICRERIESFV